MSSSAPPALEKLDSWIAGLEDLHSAPQVARRVLAMTRDLDFDLGEVVDCLKNEPALAAKILRIVNSSHFGVRREVSNLRQAVAMIGQRCLRLVLMTFSLIDALTSGAGKRVYQRYWRRAVTMAAVAARLSTGRRDLDADDAYSAGLLADLGVLVLAQLEGNRYLELYETTPHGRDLIEGERRAFGFSHPEVAARLLNAWEFPPALILAVHHHHDDRTEATPLETATRAGDLMADALWTPQSPNVERARQLLEQRFRLDIDAFIEMALALKADLVAECAVFNVHLDQTFDCQSLVKEARRQQFTLSLEDAADLDSFQELIEDHSM